MLTGRHLIEPNDLSVNEINEICSLAEQIIVDPLSFQDVCRGKILAALFFEPSTRTRLSFEAAMLRLGGSVEGFADAACSSTTKGESLADTIRVISSYADIIAMRNPKEGAALLASQYSYCPVINAGDGGHFHPTQTLADLLTIYRKKGGFDNLSIGLCGDLKYGRTVHSLINAMSRYSNISFYLISPDELKVPRYIIDEVIKPKGIYYEEIRSLEEKMDKLDVLYMTRIQKERFGSEDEYERLKDSYVLNCAKLKNAKKDMIIMHPLPRVNEISVEVDDDERACYFEQAQNGKYMRMALILKLLSQTDYRENRIVNSVKGMKCTNPRCITSVEQELVHEFEPVRGKKNTYRCIYCDSIYCDE